MANQNSAEVVASPFPLLEGLSLEAIYECAERWLALGKLPGVHDVGSIGFSEDEIESDPGRRHLHLTFLTKGAEVPASDRALALSKLTEMADLVRAAELESRIP